MVHPNVVLSFIFLPQTFHLQKHAGELKPRGRGGRVLGPSYRRAEHRPSALGARQKVPAYLQRARPGEEGEQTHSRLFNHTPPQLWKRVIVCDEQSSLCKKKKKKSSFLFALFCPWRKVKAKFNKEGNGSEKGSEMLQTEKDRHRGKVSVGWFGERFSSFSQFFFSCHGQDVTKSGLYNSGLFFYFLSWHLQ